MKDGKDGSRNLEKRQKEKEKIDLERW